MKNQNHKSILPIDRGVAVRELSSWTEFSSYIVETKANSPSLVYRGQARAEWKVETTLDRLEQRFPVKKNFSGSIPPQFECPPVSRETHLRAFKEATRGRRGENSVELSQDEWWALAQHHGLATPMLDLTYSPFVALFFAFEEDMVSNSSGNLTQPEKRAVFALSSNCICETGPAAGDTPPLPFSPLRGTSYRLTNQGALFLKMPPQTDLESYVQTHFQKECSADMFAHARCILEKIVIPNEGRVDCLKYLNKMNINRMSLFPDLDGAATFINALWELDFDSCLGYLSDVLPEE